MMGWFGGESMRGLCLVGVGLVFVTVAISAGGPLADDFKIVPGERIGDLSLHMSLDEVMKLLGTPSLVEPSETSRSTRYEWQSRFLKLVQSRDTGRTESIATWWIPGRSNPYKTEQRIAVGATASQVKQSYG